MCYMYMSLSWKIKRNFSRESRCLRSKNQLIYPPNLVCQHSNTQPFVFFPVSTLWSQESETLAWVIIFEMRWFASVGILWAIKSTNGDGFQFSTLIIAALHKNTYTIFIFWHQSQPKCITTTKCITACPGVSGFAPWAPSRVDMCALQIIIIIIIIIIIYQHKSLVKIWVLIRVKGNELHWENSLQMQP